MIVMKSVMYEVIKLAVRMKLHTNGKKQVESIYYARNIKSAVKGINCCGIIGHFNLFWLVSSC